MGGPRGWRRAKGGRGGCNGGGGGGDGRGCGQAVGFRGWVGGMEGLVDLVKQCPIIVEVRRGWGREVGGKGRG